MTEDKYQITIKAQYIKFLLLKDELEHFDEVLSEVVTNIDGWLTKLRATRSVFLTLNNVKDAAENIQINGNGDFVKKTRKLKKSLIFANHFRNRGIAHLDDILLKRAVQWSPQLFYENSKDNKAFQLIESQKTIIESCINSFINKDGVQNIFGTEIDLNYPPNAEQFFTYLSEIVNETISWISEAASFLSDRIDHHTNEKITELAVIAGQTNFNLKAKSDLNYPAEEEVKARFSNALLALEQHGVEPKILDLLRKKMQL